MRKYLVIALGLLCGAVAYGGDGTVTARPSRPATSQPAAPQPESAWLERIREALPKGWSLIHDTRGPGEKCMVSRDDPIHVIYNSPIAPGPYEKTLQITIIAGPKVTPAEHERMVQFNADLKQKFRGNDGTLALISPWLWWEKRAEAGASRPYLLPTHFDVDNSLRIDCPPLHGRSYEFKSKEDADEAAGVFAAITSRFNSHAAAASQPAATQAAAAPLAIACRAQVNYINKRQHLSVTCDIKNTTTQPISVSWGKPQVRLFPGAMIVTTYGDERDRQQEVIQATQKAQKTLAIALGQDCPYLDEGPWQIKLDFRTAEGHHQQAETSDRLQVETRSDATAQRIAAAAAQFIQQRPSWNAQQNLIHFGRWEITWWSASHWGVTFAGGGGVVEVDRKTLKPREWMDVITRPADPPVSAPATIVQPASHPAGAARNWDGKEHSTP